MIYDFGNIVFIIRRNVCFTITHVHVSSMYLQVVKVVVSCLRHTAFKMCVNSTFQRLRITFGSTISNESRYPKACKVHPLRSPFTWKMLIISLCTPTIFGIKHVPTRQQQTYRPMWWVLSNIAIGMMKTLQ